MCIKVTLIAITFALFGGGTATAQTPDGETPANEGVCDELMGLTPGLYGLCVAYCEAQDLNLIDLNDLDAFKQIPNRKILKNYRKKMKPGDPDMPCVKSPCPCWTQQEVDSAPFPQGGNQDVCLKDFSGFGRSNFDSWSVGQHDEPVLTAFQLVTIEAHTRLPGRVCIFQDVDCLDRFDPSTCTKNTVRFLGNLSEEEFQACESQLNQSGADRGFDCFIE